MVVAANHDAETQRNLVWAGNAARENRYLYVSAMLCRTWWYREKSLFVPISGAERLFFRLDKIIS